MKDLDKASMGKRIRQIRTKAGLRQWELAKQLGTTQSAVHKYEHGVVPEPRRLVELARVGRTSIEWILTGTHWENGSSEQERLSTDLLDTASILREIMDQDPAMVDEALRIVREAVSALAPVLGPARALDPEALASFLASHSESTLKLMESAYRIQKAVTRKVVESATDRLG
jgi:transcriptional regulator with XRE-family HTH domain